MGPTALSIWERNWGFRSRSDCQAQYRCCPLFPQWMMGFGLVTACNSGLELEPNSSDPDQVMLATYNSIILLMFVSFIRFVCTE